MREPSPVGAGPAREPIPRGFAGRARSYNKIAIALFLLLAFPASAQDAPSEADLRRLGEAIAAVQARIDEARGERGVLERQLDETERALAAAAQELRAVEQRIAAQEARLEDLRARQAALQAAKTEQQALIARYLRAAWLSGRQEYLKLLLNQENLDASARTLRYYRYFTEARAARIARWNATLEQLARLQADTQDAALALRQSRDELATRRAALETGRLERLALLDQLDLVLAESGSELARLQREREEVQVLIEELNRAITGLSPDARQQPFAEVKGSLPWPVDGEPLNRFGARHELGDLTWQGINLAAAPGSEVRAIHHGRVVYAGWFSGSGLLLIIDHGDGYMSLYAHNQALYKEVGDWVASGETVAAAGDTGGRRESGLYFEIRHEGRSQDPAQWCVARN